MRYYRAMPLHHITYLSAACPNTHYLAYPVTVLYTNHSCLHYIHTTHHHPICMTPLLTLLPSTTTTHSIYFIRLRQPPSLTPHTHHIYLLHTFTQPYLTATQHAFSVDEATMPHTCLCRPRHTVPTVSYFLPHPHDPIHTAYSHHNSKHT